MKIVLVSSEAGPFAKTGGLADVCGALPRALESLGHQVSLIIPCYNRAWRAGVPLQGTGLTLRVPIGSRVVEGRVQKGILPKSNVPVYLIDQPSYFDRDELYGYNGVDFEDNSERFIFFSRGALEAVRLLDLRPDVIHCNDWQTGLIPVLLDEVYRQRYPSMAQVGTLLTIHNLVYQGVFWHWDMPLTGLDWRLFNWEQLEFYGKLNFLKAGLVFADLLNTVSPTYAQEIQTPQYGCGLDHLLRRRAEDLFGIVNGIDTADWNPATDDHLAANYSAQNPWEGKAACKALLQRRAGLPERPEVPLFAQIGRLDPQKGWDLLVRPDTQKGWDWIGGVADDLLHEDVQFVVLGTGHARYHDLLGRLVQQHPQKMRVFLEFSDPLAHQIEAGADVFLMPSLYEPCGLNQLYSLMYGTIPLVRRTGGLSDTVVDATPETLANGTATGIAFHERDLGDWANHDLQAAREAALKAAIQRALALWADPPVWRQLVTNAMNSLWTWERSGRDYVQLYEEIRRRRTSRAAG
jgi:starch synthase